MLVDDRITHTDHVGASSSHALPFCAFRMLRLGHSRRPPWPVFASAAQSTHIMSYRPNVVPRCSQMTKNVFPTYKTLIQGVGTPWLAIVS